MGNWWQGSALDTLLFMTALICLAVPAAFGAYWLQRRHTLREMAAIAMQERHLYRMLRDQMEAIGKLRIARHDAKNELLVLQGFLERGDAAAARTYLAQLLRREDS